jgi:hypothetical protein
MKHAAASEPTRTLVSAPPASAPPDTWVEPPHEPTSASAPAARESRTISLPFPEVIAEAATPSPAVRGVHRRWELTPLAPHRHGHRRRRFSGAEEGPRAATIFAVYLPPRESTTGGSRPGTLRPARRAQQPAISGSPNWHVTCSRTRHEAHQADVTVCCCHAVAAAVCLVLRDSFGRVQFGRLWHWQIGHRYRH